MVLSWTPQLTSGNQYRYRALAEAIRDAIRSGELRPGDKLPPHRVMAWKLNMTAATVARAYNIASEWGLVFSRVGHGTRVREPNDAREPITLRENGGAVGGIATGVDFGLLLPTPPQDPILRRQAFKQVFARAGRELIDRSLSGYAPDLGYRAHREAGGTWLRKLGHDPAGSEVMVTRGAQEAFLLLLSMFTQPGDPVLVEETTYLGLSHLLRLRNHRLIPLPLDKDGMVPDTIERHAKQSGAKLLFLSPTLHNPTGATMPDERRLAIVEAARKADLIIVEDDPFVALYAGKRPRPLRTLAPERTFYLASLSKYAGPALRVCFVLCPQAHFQALEGVKHALTLGGAFLEAEIAAEWIRTNLLGKLCAWQRKEIEQRWSMAGTILKDVAVEHLEPAPFMFIRLPEPWRASEFVSAARQFHVTCIEADRFTVGRGGAPQAVRLALSSPATRDDVRHGLEVIAELLSKYAPARSISY